jgi:hypothetical protein
MSRTSVAVLFVASLGGACSSPSVGLDGNVTGVDEVDDGNTTHDARGSDSSDSGPDASVATADDGQSVPDSSADADGGESSLGLTEFCRRFARTYVDRHAAVCSGDADELLRQWHTGLECDQDLLESVSAGRITYSAT